MIVKEHPDVKSVKRTNGASSDFHQLWEYIADEYGMPFLQYVIKILYSAYVNFTLINVVLFLVKWIPMVIYVHKFIKHTYSESRQKLSQKRMQLEDIHLQIQIVETKLCCRESEFAEREEHLRHNIQQLRRVRAQVRQVISEDGDLLQAIDQGITSWNNEFQLQAENTPDEEYKFIEELLNWMKYEQMAPPEQEKEKTYHESETSSPENSNYASASGVDGKQDCNVKIVKVTNVYKVAFLKQFIKHKRLWRANRHAQLNKKMNDIKKLLNNWQKTLNAVINNKIPLFNMDSQRLVIASEEAMGDSSRGLHDFTNSDMDLRYDDGDDYNTWSHQYPTCGYDDTINLEMEPTKADEKYNCQFTLTHQFKESNLSTLPEETKSQLEIEEIRHKTF